MRDTTRGIEYELIIYLSIYLSQLSINDETNEKQGLIYQWTPLSH